jgi:SAM-dependent methyltransferase
MSSFFGAIRQLGVHQMLQLRRARNWGWEGLLRGHVLTRVIQTLLDVGLFDAMQQRGAIDLGAFAAERSLDRRLLIAMCDYLAGRRVLRRAATECCYELDGNGAFLMDSSALRGWIELTHGYEDVLHAMPDLLTGRRRYAAGDVQRDGHHVAVGSGRASNDFFFPLTTERIRRGGYRRVLDIGCGDAMFLRYMCARLPGVTGIGIDRSPEAVAEANAAITRDGLTGRVQVVCGDAMELGKYRTRFAGVDAATSFFVLHELCGGSGQQLLEPFLDTYQRSLPGTPLIAIEAIRPSVDQLRRRPGPAAEYSLLHDLSGQKTIGRGAWTEVLKSAGFTNLTEEHFDFARASIYTAVGRREPLIKITNTTVLDHHEATVTAALDVMLAARAVEGPGLADSQGLSAAQSAPAASPNWIARSKVQFSRPGPSTGNKGGES